MDDDLPLPPIDVVISGSTSAVVVRVRGDVDIATVGILRAALELVEDAPMILVDLAEAPFIDIAGVRAIASCAARRRALGREVRILGPPRSAEWILQRAPFCRGLRWERRDDELPASSSS